MNRGYEVRVGRVGDGLDRRRAFAVIGSAIALVGGCLASSLLGWPVIEPIADAETTEEVSPRGTGAGPSLQRNASVHASLARPTGESGDLLVTPPLVPTRECPPPLDDVSMIAASDQASIGADGPYGHHCVLGYWVRNRN